jgi:hypothetical protein
VCGTSAVIYAKSEHQEHHLVYQEVFLGYSR